MMRLKKEPLRGEALKSEILRTVTELPSMPQTVLKAREIMADPKSNFTELGKLFETDQGIASAVLKLANSAYYGLSGKVSSIQRATVVLGYKTLGELVSVAGTSLILGKSLGFSLRAFWNFALTLLYSLSLT